MCLVASLYVPFSRFHYDAVTREGEVRGFGPSSTHVGDGKYTLRTKLQSPHLEGIEGLRLVMVHARVPLDGFHKQDLRLCTGKKSVGFTVQ